MVEVAAIEVSSWMLAASGDGSPRGARAGAPNQAHMITDFGRDGGASPLLNRRAG